MPIQNVERGWTIRGANVSQIVLLLTIWLVILPNLFYMEAGPRYHQDAGTTGVKSATVMLPPILPTRQVTRDDTPSEVSRRTDDNGQDSMAMHDKDHVISRQTTGWTCWAVIRTTETTTGLVPRPAECKPREGSQDEQCQRGTTTDAPETITTDEQSKPPYATGSTVSPDYRDDIEVSDRVLRCIKLICVGWAGLLVSGMFYATIVYIRENFGVDHSGSLT